MEYLLTPSQTAGPFLSIGLTEKNSVQTIAGPQAKGERVWLKCRVLDGDGAPLNDAAIEIWQADSGGKYNHPVDGQAKTPDAACRGFGRMGTKDDGSCEFETVKPGRVPGPGNALQAPHLNIAIFARGILLQLYTRIYFAGDPANEEDPVLALVPAERRDTLLAQPDPARAGGWLFDIHLCGDKETVFFDV
ncbi:MAG: protocatechuate 3,4-dioxygenase subunit alpha [Terriglobales bacterium]